MFTDMASSIFKIENFFDEIALIDKDGVIRYCEIFVPGVYSFTADEIIGKHVLDVFESSTEEKSEIMQVLRTGKPISYFEEDSITYKGDIVKGYSSVYPLYKEGNLCGAAIALKFFDAEYSKEQIEILDSGSIKKRENLRFTLDDIISEDPQMQKLKSKVIRASKTSSAILIQGATGTGKELFAQSIHSASPRQAEPFIALNCSAVPENLLESTIFGTEKGSFTGAVTSKGLMELAHGGTLFLDEINSMNTASQSKLLKAIEEKRFRRLGGHEEIKVDVRILSAINEAPQKAIQEGRLRQDLFYRLSVVSLFIPPLCQRGKDIVLLAEYFINEFRKTINQSITGVSKEAKDLLQSYSWPGNVRELRNLIESAFNFANGNVITKEDLPEHMHNLTGGCEDSCSAKAAISNYGEKIKEFERSLLIEALRMSRNKAEAAKRLGLSPQSLNYKLDRYDLRRV